MSDFPPVLLPERIEAMLSGLAELCFAGAQEAGARLTAAEDAEAFERVTRAMQTHARNLRQTLAMKQRFDRHQAKMAAEARREALAEVQAQREAPVSYAARSRRYNEVRRHMRDLIWTEFDRESRDEALDDLGHHISKWSAKDPRGFVDAPLEDLIADLTAIMEMGEFSADPEDDEDPDDEPDEDPDDDPDDDDEDEPEPEPQRVGHRTWPPPEPAPAAEAQPEPEPEPEPEPRPPDPPPEPYVPPYIPPYIPPWEKARPGRGVPGGSSWMG